MRIHTILPPIVTEVTAGFIAIIIERTLTTKNTIANIAFIISIDAVETAVRENYDSIKKGEDTPEDIRIYLKPEDYKAYYVINSDFAGEVDLLVD